MAPSSSPSAAATSVQVALRIRPLTTQDSNSIPARFQRSIIHAVTPTSVSIETPSNALPGSIIPSSSNSPLSSKKQAFSFDQVHSPAATQYELFTSTAKPLVSRFVEGFNCTILAYGQTSSGKTFSMTGIDLDADPTDPHNSMGIIPRAVSTIFSAADMLKDERGGAWSYSIKTSFIEIYNEDLIDLLSLEDSQSGKREVLIREDKEGHIIWGGLREVSVNNTNEVMSLLRQGTSIRRTNETDMNTQSSRSHAIFSLTLTQKKFKGPNSALRSTSPVPMTPGRSPSRLARPGSMYSSTTSVSRVSSPPFGRPSTPSFAAAMSRGTGLRPASALGHHGERLMTSAASEDDAGDWVTIISKFHFVDLAGSERLKRTAAAGERIKEGISINSGLLALGNVISALGDPSRSKSNAATHVPYRDSKLTRLLQDSLGGNAHTLMIACISSAEWNAGETLNTLKYANRARNIKNRAVVNEKEDGWDDMEWLRSTVTRLRNEVKAIKEGGVNPASERETESREGPEKPALEQLSELQNNYEDLREKFVERTVELTRLRQELGEKHRGSVMGAIGGTARYEEIVGPVIEEYEKTIAAMEAELSLNKVALRHTNEMVEEKEEELTQMTERHAATELYVEELRSRVAKLTEREASTEAYVRDLEDKMKSFDESSTSYSETVTDLKREILRFKESEAQSAKYITDLENRLARSDESILSLQQTVETLEKECERRRNEVESLQARLETLRRDGESWRTDLEIREKKVLALEQKMLDWENKRKDAGETRARLGNLVEEVESAKRELEIDIATTPPTPTAVESQKNALDSVSSSPDVHLQAQLEALQQTHTATLADLNSVTAKYRDALREISDLAAQIQEAKLNPGATESGSESTAPENPTEMVAFKKRLPMGRARDSGEVQHGPHGRRFFFREAASAESLHARSLSQSQSLSQELFSVHSRKTSLSSHGTSSSHSPSGSQPTTISSVHRPTLSVSLSNIPSSPQSGERSVSSMQREIIRLQEVLREREAEIALLEDSLKEYRGEPHQPSLPQQNGNTSDSGKQAFDAYMSPKTLNNLDHIRKAMENGNGHVENGSASHTDPDDSLERLNELMLSMAQKESMHREVVDDLNEQLNHTRRQLDDLTTLSRDQALNMSMEMEALQGRLSQDLIIVEDARKREATLMQSLKDAESRHETDLEKMSIEREESLLVKVAELDATVSTLKDTHETLTAGLRNELMMTSAALQKTRLEHEEVFVKLKQEQEAELSRQIALVNEAVANSEADYQKTISKLLADHTIAMRKKDEEASESLQTTEEQYYNALTKLRGDHAEAIKNMQAETAATLERLREEHAGQMRMAEIAREGSISESESSRSRALRELQEEHEAAIARKESAFAEEVENLKSANARAMKALEEDHALQMDRLRLENETVVAKLRAESRAEMDHLQAELDAKREADVTVARQQLKSESEAAIRALQEQQNLVLNEFELGHQREVKKLRSSHTAEIQELMQLHETQGANIQRTHDEANSKLKEEIRALTLESSSRLVDLQKVHDDAIAKFNEERQTLIENSTSSLNTQQRTHDEAIAKLNETIETLQTSLDAEAVKMQEAHKTELRDLETRHDQQLQDEKARSSALQDENKQRHGEEIESLKAQIHAASQEAEARKLAADEHDKKYEETLRTHERQLDEQATSMSQLKDELSTVTGEREELKDKVARLRSLLDETRAEQSKLVQEATKRKSLVDELERHRAELAELQETLQKAKDENDALQVEKARLDSLVRDLQTQIARSTSPTNTRTSERSMSYGRSSNLASLRIQAPGPPPTSPPPPAPALNHGESNLSSSSHSSSAFNSTSSSSRDSPDSPLTSGPSSVSNGRHQSSISDSKLTVKLEQQSKQIEEQEAMIRTLNKQLTHCESDLQTHMDLVNTLENSLGDSEKNLRKVRMQAADLARERDTLVNKLDDLRNELAEAKREVVTVRRSVVEEKQSLEQRLDEERKLKERARQQLDLRMDELQRRKSKFACL